MFIVFASMVKVFWSAFQYMQQTSYSDNIFRPENIGRIRFKYSMCSKYSELDEKMTVKLESY